MKYPGVFTAEYRSGRKYYRSSVTFHNKHISLGSYKSAKAAARAYRDALDVLHDPDSVISSYQETRALSFCKWVVLCNFRDNGIYIANPVYIRPRFFYYYISPDIFFTFDQEELFYYSAHTIMKRGGHYFVSDYGMQLSVNQRYGIHAYAVMGRDYSFRNGNPFDMRSVNLEIINPYHGVRRISAPEGIRYEARIHINGYCRIGVYASPEEAAVAYNRAVDIVTASGILKHYQTNFIESVSASGYAEMYRTLNISPGLMKVCRRVSARKNQSC